MCAFRAKLLGMPLLLGIDFAVGLFSGFFDRTVARLFVVGGLAGGILGVRLGKALVDEKRAVNMVFATIVILVGIYIVLQGFKLK